MSWNKDEAISWARQHAQPHSTGYCARYVARAIEAGGLSISGANAHDFGGSLSAAGFYEMPGGTPPENGDVVVIQPIAGHPYGHTAIYDGVDWYWDFKQRTMYPGNAYRQVQPAFKIYRMR